MKLDQRAFRVTHRGELRSQQALEVHVFRVRSRDQRLRARKRGQSLTEGGVLRARIFRNVADRLCRDGTHECEQISRSMLQLGDQHAQSGVQLLQIFHVCGCAKPLVDPAGIVAHRRGARLERSIAVLADVPETVVGFERLLPARAITDRASLRPIVRMNHVEPSKLRALILGLAGELGPLRARPGPLSSFVGAPHDLRNAFHQRAGASLAVLQFVLHDHAAADVDHVADTFLCAQALRTE